MARAASHTAAVARSVSAIMPAHLCLMAWNCPIGLPNCSRILAYSDAVSVAQRATPMHSADSSVDIRARARVRLRLASTRSSPTSTALARTCATGRSGSTLATGSISTWSASRTTHSSPLSIATGSTRIDACAAAGTARTSPRMTRPSPWRVAVSPESMAYAAMASPDARRLESLVLGVVRGDQRAGDRRWHERAWHRAVAELGEHDGQFEDAEALSAYGFR